MFIFFFIFILFIIYNSSYKVYETLSCWERQL